LHYVKRIWWILNYDMKLFFSASKIELLNTNVTIKVYEKQRKT
jgi:hypothetical protein